MKKHINITVVGRVQGVFFRDHCRRTARIYGIKGFAKNLANGNVYVEAEGDGIDMEDVSAVAEYTGLSEDVVKEIKEGYDELSDIYPDVVAEEVWDDDDFYDYDDEDDDDFYDDF